MSLTRDFRPALIWVLHARTPCAAVGSPPSWKVSVRPGADLGPARADTVRGSREPPCRGAAQRTHPRPPQRLREAPGSVTAGPAPTEGAGLPYAGATPQGAPLSGAGVRPNGWPPLRPFARPLTPDPGTGAPPVRNAYGTPTG